MVKLSCSNNLKKILMLHLILYYKELLQNKVLDSKSHQEVIQLNIHQNSNFIYKLRCLIHIIHQKSQLNVPLLTLLLQKVVSKNNYQLMLLTKKKPSQNNKDNNLLRIKMIIKSKFLDQKKNSLMYCKKLILIRFLKISSLLRNQMKQKLFLMKLKKNKKKPLLLQKLLMSKEKFIDQLLLKVQCFISYVFHFASYLICINTLLNRSNYFSIKLCQNVKLKVQKEFRLLS